MHFSKSISLRSLSFLVLIGLLFTQCKQEQKSKQTDPAFTSYITAFTGGIVSNQASIKVRLAEAHSKAVAGQIIEEKLFDFSPNIEGQALWIDNQTIEFKPAKLLPSGKLFEAKFFLSKLIKTPSKLKIFEFEFQVMKQALDIEFGSMESYNAKDLAWQMLNGLVRTYDYADEKDIEQAVKAMQNGKELSMSWEHLQMGKIHRFVIDSIQRTESRGQVILEWNGKTLGMQMQDEKAFDVPPLGEFKVLDIKVNQQGEQYVSIFFSDPIKEDQDLDGLIYFKPNKLIKLVRDGNIVEVHPSSTVNSSVNLIVSDGIRSAMGYQLLKSVDRQITFQSINPAIELIGKGVVLPNTQGLLFPFKAVNLSAVNIKVIKIFEDNLFQFFQNNQLDGKDELKRVGRLVYKGEITLKSDEAIDYGSWNNFSVDLSDLISPEPGAIYRVILGFTKSQSLYPCDEKEDKEEVSLFQDDNEDAYWDDSSSYWYYSDGADDYDYNSNYNYQDRNNPCKPSFYMRSERSVARNILASDIGIIAKGGLGNNLVLAITNLKTTEPIAGAKVEMYNFQQQLIGSASSNSDGFVHIDLNNKPFLVVVKHQEQRGYLRLDDGSALSLSMFDIGGQKNKEGLKGFIYGERGVWRPGDSLFISFILEDKNRVLPEKHPVVFELYTPQQQLFERKVSTSSLNGFYDFRTATPADAPTGNWLAKVKLGGSEFSQTIKIETIKPNRLKISLDFHSEFLSNSKKAKGDLEVKWLHGAVANQLKTDIELNLSKGSTTFKGFVGYSFDDASKDFNALSEIIYEGKVDENGKAVIAPDFQVQENAPGMLKANFKIRAFEKSGDFSVDRFSMPFSPYRGYVGIKMPEGKGWNGALYSEDKHLIPIVTVDEEGKLINRKGVKIEIYNVYWRWWWERSSDDDLARYVANRSQNLIQTASVDTKDGKAMYEMNLGGNHYGRKFIRVIDPVTGHSAGQSFYVTYKGWGSDDSGNSPGGAEMLSFTTDKKKYEVGEKMKVNIPAAKEGRILVSLEAGSKILDNFWVPLKNNVETFEIDITPEMTPNVFVHLSLIQPHNTVKNDLPIRLYGVQGVNVENPESHLKPLLTMPDVLAPEEEFTVNVSEEQGRKMTYTLAVVDDGLLDLTRFKTPDPWLAFHAKEALSVKTWDMYKYVIGAFTGKMAGLLALGGDENLGKAPGAKANRFKPVVEFLGPFELQANQKKAHKIKMPNYVGSVRTMLIAGDLNAYGSAQKTCPVKKPLMVLATLPRVLGPGEKLTLPVTVFVMDEKIEDVEITVQTNNLLKIEGEAKQNIHFSRIGDQVVNFKIAVEEKIGIATAFIEVKSGKEKATYAIELDVRAPNPRVTDVIDAMIEPGDTWESTYHPLGIVGTNKGVLEMSSIPSLNLESRLQYLMQYPHGCIEQTTSAAFPQLYLSNLLDLSAIEKVEIEENIKTALDKFRSFQIYSGGFSYWPGNQLSASEWGTNYAGHFMLEAQAKGYALPPGLLFKWIAFQKQKANDWTADSDGSAYKYRQIIQAYRLYTLALANEPVLGAMNRLRTLKGLSPAAKWRLAAAYYLVGKKKIAEELIANNTIIISPYKELSNSFGSANRDKAMILETLTLLGKKKEAKIILDELSDAMSSNQWFSTQTTAYTLLAAAKFIGDSDDASKTMNYELNINGGKKIEISESSPIAQTELPMKGKEDGVVKIKNTGSKTLFVKLQLEGIPAAGDKTNAENALQMTLRYLNLNGEEIDPGKITQGTDFIAEVQFKHPGVRDNYREMALTQIFPSGWEIRNLRMDGIPMNTLVNIPDYQDIRDDRVLSYFDLNRAEKKTFRVMLNAAYVGTYYLPTVYCEAMYDNEINARKAGQWVQVIEAGK